MAVEKIGPRRPMNRNRLIGATGTNFFPLGKRQYLECAVTKLTDCGKKRYGKKNGKRYGTVLYGTDTVRYGTDTMRYGTDTVRYGHVDKFGPPIVSVSI